MSQQQQQSTAEGEGWFVEITDQPLDLLRLTGLVTNPAAGAISTFIGTTRNNFDNKAVLYLEYEAYVPMAVAKLKVLRLLATRIVCARVWACGCECSLQSSARPAGSGSSRANTNIFLPNGMLFLPQPVNCGGITQELCLAVQQQWQVTHVAIAHRTGTVKVCEASVIIAVSSPHRQAALQATQWAIDELKATVPIWKKEFFEDGSMWKENAESRRLLQQQQQKQPQHEQQPQAQ